MKTPMEAKTFNDICSLKRDNLTAGGYWIILNELGITICKQNPGEEPTQEITIPRKSFNRMVKWYTTGKTK